MMSNAPKTEKGKPYGIAAIWVREALAAGAKTPKEIVAMRPGVDLEVARRACLDMARSGVVVRDSDGHFHATEHIMSEMAFKEYQSEIRREAALARRQPETEPNPAVLQAVNAVLVAWR